MKLITEKKPEDFYFFFLCWKKLGTSYTNFFLIQYCNTAYPSPYPPLALFLEGPCLGPHPALEGLPTVQVGRLWSSYWCTPFVLL